MQEEMITVPMQDIAFAAKKDGSFISNFMEGGGGTIDAHAVSASFKSVVNYIQNCPEQEFVMFSIIYLIEHNDINRAIISRMEKIKKQKENE